CLGTLLHHSFSLQRCGDHRLPHSFPTRRSSDLPRSPSCPSVARESRPSSPRKSFPFPPTAPNSSQSPSILFPPIPAPLPAPPSQDRKSTRLNSSHVKTSYAVFCLKKKVHRAQAP